jgi:hypothetical protein
VGIEYCQFNSDELNIIRALTETPGYLGCLYDLHAFANYVSDIGQNLDLAAAEAFLSAANLQWNASTDISSDAWNRRIQALIDTSGVPFGDFQVSYCRYPVLRYRSRTYFFNHRTQA